MGVTIQAESGHGGGTAFRLTLPPSRTAPANGRPPVAPTAPSQPPTRPLR
jgi:hypothetical protein